MDQIFAPWRIDWVERSGNDEYDQCVFCELPDRTPDREYYHLARSEHAYVLLNNYPYNPGHTMVIPRQHTGEYGALDREPMIEKERLIQRTIAAMEDSLRPDGFNVGYNLGGAAAGGSIDDHLHAHVIPRWEGDTNFMPTIADTTVIVEAVLDTYDRLHEAFAAQDDVEAVDEQTAVHILDP